MFLSRLGKLIAFICGFLLFLFGFYLLLLHYDVFPVIEHAWMSAVSSITNYLNSREFSDWIMVAVAILAIVGGMMLMFWGIRKTK